MKGNAHAEELTNANYDYDYEYCHSPQLLCMKHLSIIQLIVLIL